MPQPSSQLHNPSGILSNRDINQSQSEQINIGNTATSGQSSMEAPRMAITTSSMSTKEPKTPSLPRPAIFSSPAPQMALPETPERGPRHIRNVDETPLLSPPMTNTNSFLQTPQRRKGSTNNGATPDFYSLFKSPEVQMEDKKLKRRSMELYNITDAAKSPEQIHREYDTEHLLKSPRRDYKEIRKLSENLRTRLNYANVKVQHGWSKKSIGELEHSLEEIATNPQRANAFNNKQAPHPDSKQLDDFWNLRADNLPTAVTSTKANTEHENKGGFSSSGLSINNVSPLRQSNAPKLMESPGFATGMKYNHHRRKSSFASSINLDDVAKRGVRASPELRASADFPTRQLNSTAMMSNPSASSNSSLPLGGLQTSPLKKFDQLKRSGSQSKRHLKVTTVDAQPSDRLEQDAIISLISLSSPGKYNNSSMSPSPPKQFGSPIKGPSSNILLNGLPSLDGISNKRLPPLPNVGNVPLSAPGLLGSNWGNLGDHHSLGGVTNYEKYANHHRHTSSTSSTNSANERYLLPTPPKFESLSGGLLLSTASSKSAASTALGVSPQIPTAHLGRPGGMIVTGSGGAGGGDDETTEEEVTDDEETFIADTSRKSAAGTSV